MSDSLEEEKRRKLIEAGRRALEERKKKRQQQTPDGTNIDVKGPNSAPTVETYQSRRSDLESLRLSTLRAKQELELNKTTNELTDFSVRNDKPTLFNGNSHPSQQTSTLAPLSPKLPTSEQSNKVTIPDPISKPISEISSNSIPSKIVDPVSPIVPNRTQTNSPKSDLHSNLIPNNGHSTTSSMPSLVFPPLEQKYPNLLSPFKPESSLPSQQPVSPILSPAAAFKPNPFEIPLQPEQVTFKHPTPSVPFPAAQPLEAQPSPTHTPVPQPTPVAPLPATQPNFQHVSLIPKPSTVSKPQSPIGSPRMHQETNQAPAPKPDSHPLPSTQTQPDSPKVQPVLAKPQSPVVAVKAVPQPTPVVPLPVTQHQAPSPIQSPVIPAKHASQPAAVPTTQPTIQPESSPKVQPASKPSAQSAPVEQANGTSEPHQENIPNGNSHTKNGSSSHPQPDRRLQVLMDEVSNKSKELEEMKSRMEQYQAKYDAELKKNEKLMDKLEFIKRKEMEERPLLEEIISRETLELLDKLKEENAQLKNQLSNVQTQFQSLEKKSKQQLESISQLMSEKNQITQEMQRRIDRILENQAMNVPSSQVPSPRPEIANSEIESAQSQGKDAIRRILEDKANLENKINEQWETIQSMSKQKTELLTRLANEAQRNEALIKENARLRNSHQTPPSPTAEPHHSHSHSHSHTNGNGHQHHHASTTPSEIEVVNQSSGGWLTYIPIVGGYFSPSAPPPKQTRNV